METGHQTSASPHSLIPSAKVLACALIAGSVLVINAARDEQPPQPSAAQAFPTSVRPTPSRAAPAALPTVLTLPPSDPVRLRVPAIGVDAPMTRLDLDAAGALRPPPADSPGLAGWYGAGTAPGSTGTAVATGHVDTRTGPGVFYDLGALTKGDTIEISRADERTAVFTVDAVEVYDKKKFPDEKVYGSSERPELRVITCGGGYTKGTGYQGNVVVFATLSAVK
ncbi:class F sortase [Streptomyces sp. NBC_00322]|uniref:class F sortase n=1 Tax=Streptomyces sp. NBC_00322 TaxID=2975712 RepID=UPI002E29EFFF|nr:class F sortase [Streptomyces sp. NBC_00322]